MRDLVKIKNSIQINGIGTSYTQDNNLLHLPRKTCSSESQFIISSTSIVPKQSESVAMKSLENLNEMKIS